MHVFEVLNNLSWLAYWAVGAVVIGIMHVTKSKRKSQQAESQVGGLIEVVVPRVFVVVGTVVFIFCVLSARQRISLMELICDCRPAETKLQLNGRAVRDNALILSELSKLLPPNNHHSGPKEPVLVQMNCEKRNVVFVLREDSRVSGEFWVYWDRSDQPTHWIANVRAPSVLSWLEESDRSR